MNVRNLFVLATCMLTLGLPTQAMEEIPPKDGFDFLRTHPKHSGKVSEADIRLVANTDETKTKSETEQNTLFEEFKTNFGFRAYLLRDLSQQAARLNVSKTPTFINFVEADASTNKAVALAESLKNTSPDATKSERLYDNRKANKHLPVYEDIVLAARKLLDRAVREGTKQTFVCLGRTACLVHIALQETLKMRPQENVDVVHVSFSGHPDALTLREEEMQTNVKKVLARDIVTPENLALYLTYLESLNLHTATNIKIIDMMETGAGLNAFMGVYDELCRSRGQQPAKIELMMLTPDPTFANRDEQLFDRGTLAPLQPSSKRRFWEHHDGIITFPENRELNIKPYRLQVTPIFIGRTTLWALDYAEYQSFLYHGKLLPACRWTQEWISKINDLSELQRKCQVFLRANFKNTIEWHEKKIWEMK